MEDYRFECATLEGFVQRAVVLSQHGYRFFVAGEVPARKRPEDVDERMLGKYDVRKSKRQRAYRKEQGLENGHYFRHGANWVLMATAREFFLEVDPNERVLDLQERDSVRVGGYSISLRRDGSLRRRGEHRFRASVRLDKPTYLELKAHLEELAVHRRRDWLEREFRHWSTHYQVYAPVRRQLLAIFWSVNKARKRAGFEQLSSSCIRTYRKLPKHFGRARGPAHKGGEAAA